MATKQHKARPTINEYELNYNILSHRCSNCLKYNVFTKASCVFCYISIILCKMKAYIQFCMFLSGPGKFIYFIEYSFSRTRFIHRTFYRTPLISLMSFHLLIGDKRLTRDNVDNSSTLETYFQQLTHYEPISISTKKCVQLLSIFTMISIRNPSIIFDQILIIPNQ